ncbi:MAG: metallophosphoesterase family protein [Pseudomonadota bacterium]
MLTRKKSQRWTPKGKSGQRAYAIGDIHGCLDQTHSLLQKIKAHSDYRDDIDTHVIFLGDLVDRGPNSKGVVELLMDFPFSFAKPLFVMGNHEEMMVRALSGEPELLPEWLEYGGYACAESYGIPQSQLLGQSTAALEHLLRSAIPKSHVEFLRGFLDYVQFGDFLFTHAGIRPGLSLGNQNSRDMRWIRQPFLNHKGDLGVMVVHGHTISEDVVVKSNRIGLDTGAYKTGRLSAVCIEYDQVSFIDTR